MIQQSKGKMYLADERGRNESTWFRSLNTFWFGRYQREHKEPFGSLYVLNEDTLAGNKSFSWAVEEDSAVILIPIVGAIEITDSTGNASLIQAGMSQLLNLPAGATYTVKNPYQEELVKYLQLWLRSPVDAPTAQQVEFELDTYQLTTLFDNHLPDAGGYACSLMKLDGRQEEVYQRKYATNGIFAFVIQGALEVQYRLMHEGDGLGLWDLNEIEFEALSNDAILLIAEVPV